MLYYLRFGSPDGFGHGQHDDVLIDVPAAANIVEAEKHIRQEYGNNFFASFAEDPNDRTLTAVHAQALTDHNFNTVAFLRGFGYDIDDYFDCDLESFNTYWTPSREFSLSEIEFIFIWLLNIYGAQITIPTIDVIDYKTLPGFQSVGYGCFEVE